MIFVGIDLAGSPQRSTGICFINGKHARTAIAFGDDELRAALKRLRPTYVGMDAPIFLPLGRCCLRNDCTCPRDIHFRLCAS
jgi:uncharacterized protein